MLLYFKNSILATLVSIFGCGMVLCGIMLFPEGEIVGGILILIFGGALIYWGSVISKNKAFKKWWKQIKANNLEPQIAQSVETAIAIYNKNPQKRTLKKIAKLNPDAARQIEAGAAVKKG